MTDIDDIVQDVFETAMKLNFRCPKGKFVPDSFACGETPSEAKKNYKAYQKEKKQAQQDRKTTESAKKSVLDAKKKVKKISDVELKRKIDGLVAKVEEEKKSGKISKDSYRALKAAVKELKSKKGTLESKSNKEQTINTVDAKKSVVIKDAVLSGAAKEYKNLIIEAVKDKRPDNMFIRQLKSFGYDMNNLERDYRSIVESKKQQSVKSPASVDSLKSKLDKLVSDPDYNVISTSLSSAKKDMLVNIMSDFESRSKKNNIPLIAGVQIKGDDDTDSEESSARDIGTFAYYDVRGGWMDIDPKALSKKFPYNDNVSESDIDYLRTNISKIKDENSRNLALKRLDEESRAYSNDKIKKVNGWENLETVRPMISSSYLKSSGYGKTVLDHEFGHHIFQNRDDIREKTRTIFRSLQDDGIKSASIYGETNDTEWFAENYTLHVNGRDDLVHPKLLPVIKDLV